MWLSEVPHALNASEISPH